MWASACRTLVAWTRRCALCALRALGPFLTWNVNAVASVSQVGPVRTAEEVGTMGSFSQDRRRVDRRAQARSGRRATDRAGSPITAPSCPSCGGVANEVGESEGGWWFVCPVCDHLWNERKRRNGLTSPSRVSAVDVANS
jgi:hypothetical protein